MTLYWKLARICQRLVPHKWMRVWAMDHVRSLHLCIVEPVLDLTLVPHKPVSIVLNGQRLLLQPGDIVNLEMEPPVLPPPPTFPTGTVLH